MKTRIDHRSRIGETHGIYTIVSVEDGRDKYGHIIHKCVCNMCGFVKYDTYPRVTGKRTVYVCRHVREYSGTLINYKEDKWQNARIGKIFRGMIDRCYNERERTYRFYGKVGVKICDEWLNNPISFEKWSLQNGYDDNLTIDRINSKENYSPENCRWVTNIDNSKYKSTTFYINVDSEIHTGKDWARKLGFNENLINRYISKYGLDNTVDFIRKYMHEPRKTPLHKQSYFNAYMNDNTGLHSVN